MICYRNHTDLGFFRGTDLRDPKGLLEGTGKNLRHVKIRTTEDIRPADLQSLIREALALDDGATSRTPSRRGTSRRGTAR